MCDAHYINGCEKQGTIQLKDRRGRTVANVCSDVCGNEYAGEISEGTWCPFPDAKNALSQEQIEENLSYFWE
jgi:hypothetical protein